MSFDEILGPKSKQQKKNKNFNEIAVVFRFSSKPSMDGKNSLY